MTLPQGVEMSHIILERFLSPGDIALDATCGNGHDTVFLAELVGEEGRVLALDIQAEAVKNTQALLKEQGLTRRVEVLQGDHSKLKEHLSSLADSGEVKKSKNFLQAIVFNLGYLPGSDKEVITEAETTIAALKQSLEFLALGGVLIVVLYTGHDGGEEEGREVLAWAKELDYQKFNVLHHKFLNQPNDPPQVIAITRR